MKTYYIQENGEIVLFDKDKTRLENTLKFMPQYKNLEILETENVIVNGAIMTKEECEEKQAQEEKERVMNLNLTASDVERAIYQARGMDFEDILALVSENPPQGLDIKALKIELKANNFYRGNPYVSRIGALLGFSEVQLDEFFKTGDYKTLTCEV